MTASQHPLRLLFGLQMALGFVLVLIPPSARAAHLPGLNPQALECFRSGGITPCQRALLQAEALQRSAAAQSNYSCQTMVLGLEADVIMSQLHAGRGEEAIAMLEEVNQRCRGL